MSRACFTYINRVFFKIYVVFFTFALHRLDNKICGRLTASQQPNNSFSQVKLSLYIVSFYYHIPFYVLRISVTVFGLYTSYFCEISQILRTRFDSVHSLTLHNNRVLSFYSYYFQYLLHLFYW